MDGAPNLSWALVHEPLLLAAAADDVAMLHRAEIEAKRVEGLILAVAEESATHLSQVPLPENWGFLHRRGGQPASWFQLLFEASRSVRSCPREVDLRYRGLIRFAGERPVEWMRDGAWRGLVESDAECSCGWASKLGNRVRPSGPPPWRRDVGISCESIAPAVCKASLNVALVIEGVFEALLAESSSAEAAINATAPTLGAIDPRAPVRELIQAYHERRTADGDEWFTLAELETAAGRPAGTFKKLSSKLQSEGILEKSPTGTGFRVLVPPSDDPASGSGT